MITRIALTLIGILLIHSIGFSQTNSSRQRSQSATPTPTPTPASKARLAPAPVPVQSKPMPTPSMRTQQLRPAMTPALIQPTPTPVPPPDIKTYLDRYLANAKDNRFHITMKGKDLGLTPFHVWPQKSTGINTTSTCIDMRSDQGVVYDIDFLTTGAQVTAIRLHKINGESVR